MTRTVFRGSAAAGGGLMAFVVSAIVSAPAFPQAEETQEDVEPLTRGPIHEGFAAPFVFDPQPGMTVTGEPPGPVEEFPPEEKPVGHNVVWIPGYWSWDDERQDFIWVSGIWRDVPPGREFVPGYWHKTDAGWQWISGYWRPATRTETHYLPPPPASLEVGPSSEPPSVDYVWAPGCWVWRSGRYLWRPGSWIAVRADWVWVPSHYVWTPGGCVFVAGYWDYVPVRRGLIFAPCYIPRRVLRPRYVFTPRIVVDVGLAFDYCFARPRYVHYYFGDYYDAVHVRLGYFPTFRYYHSRVGCDPIFAYRVVRAREGAPRFVARVKNRHQFLASHAEARPRRTFREQEKLLRTRASGGIAAADRQKLTLARPLSRVRSETRIKLQPADKRVEDARRAATVRRLGNSRRETERTVGRDRRAPGSEARPFVRKSPRSPIIGPSADAVRAPATPRRPPPRRAKD